MRNPKLLKTGPEFYKTQIHLENSLLILTTTTTQQQQEGFINFCDRKLITIRKLQKAYILVNFYRTLICLSVIVTVEEPLHIGNR